MDESVSASFVSVEAEKDCQTAVVFKPLGKKEYSLDDEIKLFFSFPENRCPSYLDVIRMLPVVNSQEQTSGYAIIFSYCHWKVESGAGQFSVAVKVESLLKLNTSVSDEGCEYVAQYLTLGESSKAVAESEPFLIKFTKLDSLADLPGTFSDDGLVVLSGSDSEIELIDDEVDEKKSSGSRKSSEGDGEDLTIVMSEMELRKIENENKASNEKLRSFIDQYKADLLELTRCNETLKQKLYDEQLKVSTIEKLKSSLQKELAEAREQNSQQKSVYQIALVEREKQLRDEQKKSAKLEEEVSLLTGHVENLRCCVDAHLETKNLLIDEISLLKKEKTACRKQQHLVSLKNVEKSTDTSDISESACELEDKVQKLISKLQSARSDIFLKSRTALMEDMGKLFAENNLLTRKLEVLTSIPKAEKGTQTCDLLLQKYDQDERVQDLVKRLQAAKIEYISLYKENKRKEKALENICNWASLAKDGMSLEAPSPSSSQVPSLITLSKDKFSTSHCTPSVVHPTPPLPKVQLEHPNMLYYPAREPPVEPKLPESRYARDVIEEDLIELGSESKLSLPPRQKRKIELVRRSSAAATTSSPPTSVLRALQKGKMVVRGRHRIQDGLRNLQVKRDIASLEQEPVSGAAAAAVATPSATSSVTSSVTPVTPTPANASNASKQAARMKIAPKKKETPKPSAPEVSLSVELDTGSFEAISSKPLNLSTGDVPKGTNTYSAAHFISGFEADVSHNDEEPSVNNPNVCPLCVTSILDYEDHMRQVHHKQPCPICGYVFDSNTPLYVMTYHIERHLDDNPDGPSTQ